MTHVTRIPRNFQTFHEMPDFLKIHVTSVITSLYNSLIVIGDEAIYARNNSLAKDSSCITYDLATK